MPTTQTSILEKCLPLNPEFRIKLSRALFLQLQFVWDWTLPMKKMDSILAETLESGNVARKGSTFKQQCAAPLDYGYSSAFFIIPA